MKKAKLIIPILSIFIVFVVFFSLRTSIAYLIDTDDKVNIVTVGEVKLEVSEGYEESTVAAGGTLNKAPQITNTGTTDEYVFFRIEVPKKNVTLLYEEDKTVGDTTYKKGTPTTNNLEDGKPKKNVDEIFKIIATGETATQITLNNGDTAEPKDKPQLDFSYNKGVTDTENPTENKEGWIYLKREIAESEDYNYNYYYFGYNKCLVVDQETIPLFDKIQLKSFIDEELFTGTPKTDSNVTVNVKAYGIQADSLGIDDLDKDAYLSKETLETIFKIVENKPPLTTP